MGRACGSVGWAWFTEFGERTVAERNYRKMLFITLLAGGTLGLAAGPAVSSALGQPAGGQPGADAPTTEQTPGQLLRDFVHFTFIDRPDLAVGVASELLGRNMPAAEFVDLVEETGEDLERFQQAVLRLGRMDGGRETAEAMWSLYNQGKLDRARNADEISEAIQMLLGDARSRLLARERLVAAGEYAMTQLFEQMTARNNDRMQAEVSRLIIDMGQQAVMPLCAALRGSDPVVQERIADLLGLIGYRTALPFLFDTASSAQVEAVRTACARAIQRLGRDTGMSADVGTEYLVLAERYYDEQREVTAFPGEQTQLLWAFAPETGLRSTGIATSVFHEAVAMELATRALELNGANASATAMWVAANLSREIDGPASYRNPAYPSTRRGADYYAVASGTDIAMRVLARGIDDRDTPLTLRAISALGQTAGAAALAGRVEAGQMIGDQDRRPLLEALSYPNRRVQYETALALGMAQPRQSFPGVERVVPTLAAAVRDPGAQYAVIVAADAERYNSIRRILESLNYQVLPNTARIADVQGEISAVPGIDLVVTSLTTETTRGQIDEIRRDARLAATPVVALVSGEGYTNLRRVYERDSATAVRPLGAGENEIRASVQGLVQMAAGGPITRQEAERFRDRALSVLRDLAVSGNPVLSVADASESLVGGLEGADPITRLRIAEVLSYVSTDRVQVALMDMALSTNLSEDERVQMMSRVAASAKRFGSRLEDRQITRALALARSTTASEREAIAASALLGALNLQSQSIVPLILGEVPRNGRGT